MLLAGLAANEHFTWKVVHVVYQSMVPTVSVCLSVGLTESARSSLCKDGSIRYLGGSVGSVLCRNARFMAGRVAAYFIVCPCPTSGHLVWGTLDLDALQELIHQGRLLCKGTRQLYDLSRQVLFAILIGRAWKECASLSSGRVVDSVHEI